VKSEPMDLDPELPAPVFDPGLPALEPPPQMEEPSPSPPRRAAPTTSKRQARKPSAKKKPGARRQPAKRKAKKSVKKKKPPKKRPAKRKRESKPDWVKKIPNIDAAPDSVVEALLNGPPPPAKKKRRMNKDKKKDGGEKVEKRVTVKSLGKAKKAMRLMRECLKNDRTDGKFRATFMEKVKKRSHWVACFMILVERCLENADTKEQGLNIHDVRKWFENNHSWALDRSPWGKQQLDEIGAPVTVRTTADSVIDSALTWCRKEGILDTFKEFGLRHWYLIKPSFDPPIAKQFPERIHSTPGGPARAGSNYFGVDGL